MRNRTIRQGLGILLVTLGGLGLPLAAGCDSGDGSPSGPSNPAGHEIYVSDPDPEAILAVSFSYDDGSSHVREVPVTQMLVMFEVDVTVDQAEATLADMVADHAASGLALVGQMPRIGIYQLEILNDEDSPAAAIATLDAVIDALAAYPGVEQISYNELLEERFAENDDDNTEVAGFDRAAYGMIDYFQAIPAFDEVMSGSSLSPVKVAIVDSGIDLETGQFDEIQSTPGGFDYLDVADPAIEPMDLHPQKHGTAIASIIAADNGDGVSNGIALRVLGNRLSLFVANTHVIGNIYNQARTLAGTEIAVQRGARIVNISQGRNDEGRTPRWLTRMQDQYLRVFTAPGSQDVLFVCAASNDRLELDGNDAPAGLPAPNCLTVGGLLSSTWNVMASATARGPGIDIAAPATRIGACCVGNVGYGWSRRFVSGNSFAAPIVASIAAIVLSLDPGMSGAQLSEFLTDPNHTYPAPEDVGGVRPALLKTAGTALLSLGSGGGDEEDLLDIIHHTPDALCDPPGHVINRLVGEAAFQVTGPNHEAAYSMDADDMIFDINGANFGLIQPGSFEMKFARGTEIVNIIIDREFEIGRTYTIPADGDFGLWANNPDGSYFGGGVSGTLTLTACELTTRSVPLDYFDEASGMDIWQFIQVEGVLSGGVADGIILSDPIQEDVTYHASGTFNTGFFLLAPDAGTIDRLESTCQGGYRD